jgi:hypothetical protein
MVFGFTPSRLIEHPYVNDGKVSIFAGNSIQIDFTPNEARLYALKLLKAADKAEDE